MFMDILKERWQGWRERTSFWHKGQSHDYAWLLNCLEGHHQNSRTTVINVCDGNPHRIEWLLSLMDSKAVVGLSDERNVVARGRIMDTPHPLLGQLRASGHAGLVLFSSGTTGEPKAVLHDFERLGSRFLTLRSAGTTLLFLPLDHIGGVDTMLHVLSGGGTLVIPTDRSPDTICQAVEDHRVTLLPTTPAFLNLLMASGAHKRHDLSSLKTVTYGAARMPETLLARCQEEMPDVKFVQKYGTSETSTLRAKTDGLWMQLNHSWRVNVDGVLEVKVETSMLGYLNAPSPFTEDGWYVTGDRVEVDGNRVHVLGRDGDLINVGGEKVDPAQVEAVLCSFPGVLDAVVWGEPNTILGQVPVARVQTADGFIGEVEVQRLMEWCFNRLPRHAIPMRWECTKEPLTDERGKKVRR